MPRPRYHGTARTYLISFALFALFAFLTLSFARGYQVDIGNGQISKHGVLLLNSQPSSATVTIDGKRRSQRTTARLSLPAASYDVKVERAGAHPWEHRVVIEPGKAVLFEHIALYAKQPVSKVLSTQPVTATSLSSNRRSLAAVTREATGTGLWLGNAEKLQRLTVLPNTDPATVALKISPDGRRLAVLTGGQILLYSDSGTVLSTGTGAALLGFEPGQTDSLLLAEGGGVVRVTGGQRSMVEPAATAVAVSDRAWYVALGDGSVVRYDERGRKELLAPAGGSAIKELLLAGDSGLVLAKTTQNTLLALSDGGITTLAGDVTGVAVTPSGQAAIYVSNRELHIWHRADDEDLLVTRFGRDIGAVALADNGHNAYYLADGELHAIAEDGSNDTVVGRVTDTPLWTSSYDYLTLSAEGVLRTVDLQAS